MKQKETVTMFGNNVRQLLRKNKTTSRELAKQIGVSQTYISNLLTGVKKPSMKTIDKIAAYFAVTPSDLLTAKKPPPKEEVVALAQKYESVLLALEAMRPELAAELSARIEAAAGLFPRTDASEKLSQCGVSYFCAKKCLTKMSLYEE